jgi:CubicO group peptidase (beta-lactamase class C family)
VNLTAVTEQHDALAALVADYAAQHRCPSISWGIVSEGQVAVAGAVGTLDVEAPAPRTPTADTVYRIASMTKSFTCAAILALRDDGVLSLADRIADIAPELAAVTGPTADAAPITVGDLMSMASGLATDDAWADRHLEISDDELDALVAQGVLFAHGPGTAYEYSNLGFGLLGRVVLRATGRTVQQHISERLLAPLHMTRSTWVQPHHDDWARPHRVQDGAIIAEGTPLQGDGGMAPMGGLWTTVADLARWVHFLDEAFPPRDGADDGPLRRASRREMQRIHTFDGSRMLAGQRLTMGYGYGLRVGDSPTLGRIVTHAGGLPGYGSNMRWLSRRRLGAVALANGTYAPMSELTMRMLMLLDEAGAVPSAPQPPSPEVADAAAALVGLLGDWRDEMTDEMTDAVFADNVAPDESFARRADAARRLVDACGGSLEVLAITPSSGAGATIDLAHPSGTPARVRFELAPGRPLRVQYYEIILPGDQA